MALPALPLLCLWLFLDGATVSVVTTPLLLLYARDLPPWQVACAGGAASSAGSALQMVFFRAMLSRRRPWMQRFLPTQERVRATLARWPSASFAAIAIARATPLPDAPVKLAVAAGRYPLALYFLAVLLGALPYYFALAWIGHRFAFPLWAIGLVAAVFVLGLAFDLLRRRRPDGAA